MKDYLKLKEAAEILGCTVVTVHRYCKKGILTATTKHKGFRPYLVVPTYQVENLAVQFGRK